VYARSTITVTPFDLLADAELAMVGAAEA